MNLDEKLTPSAKAWFNTVRRCFVVSHETLHWGRMSEIVTPQQNFPNTNTTTVGEALKWAQHFLREHCLSGMNGSDTIQPCEFIAHIAGRTNGVYPPEVPLFKYCQIDERKKRNDKEYHIAVIGDSTGILYKPAVTKSQKGNPAKRRGIGHFLADSEASSTSSAELCWENGFDGAKPFLGSSRQNF